MKFCGIKQINIDSIGLSQIYISLDKYSAVTEWFCPEHMEIFQPVSVYDFGNSAYTLTDGHTRTLVAYQNGISAVPAIYDNDDIVTNTLGQMLYKADIEWCARFGLLHIKHLENRIINKSKYEKLWMERCNRSYNLITGTSENDRIELQALVPELFLYGASEDVSELYFENESGDLFVYRKHILLPEQDTKND